MLFCLQLVGVGKVFPIFHKLTLGKDASCSDVVLCPGPGVGRRHCELFMENGTLHVLDLDCETLVNNKPVKESAKLFPGDVLQCGEEQFTIFQPNNSKALLAREKMSRLTLECDRIRAKSDNSNSGLTENQIRTLERNDQEINALELQIIALVQTTGGNLEENADGEENLLQVPDNEMLDRTMVVESKNRTVQTYDSLMERIHQLNQVIDKLQIELSLSDHQGNRDQEEEEDELDRFMAQNAQQLRGQDYINQQRQLAEARAEREMCEKLASVAKPALLHFTRPVSSPPLIEKPLFREVPQELENPHKKQELLWEEEHATTSTWQPPTSQTGDGRSKLNLRFGY
ncbi:hypothetical protein BASA81_003602 [Batrachochytrium salamandrivorans]|nr:hypothetical protein BASA81_003602 [Batrachochytrium salamandrivorans]